MDIHRCRFVEFPAAGISSLAFSHTSNPAASTPPDLRLAVGREGGGGDIEIWNVLNGDGDNINSNSAKWTQERILRGGQGQTVEQVAWTQEQDDDDDKDEEEGEREGGKPSQAMAGGKLRLFSIGGSAAVTEWDLTTGVRKRQAEGNFGDIWCFAAQPRPQQQSQQEQDQPRSSQLLAAGCSDGSIVLFSTEDDDLRFSRVLVARPATKKTKVLSITWRDPSTVVAGYENGSIRWIDVPSRRTLRQVTLGSSGGGGSTTSSRSAVVVVWTVKCLPDGTVVSGDSAGELKVWDARNGALVQSLRTHKADILDIACNARGDRLWSVGTDRRTVSYRLSTVPGVRTQRWVELSHRQYHKSDAKCVAVFESADLGGVLVSGGMDAGPIVQSLAVAEKTNKTMNKTMNKTTKKTHHHHRTLPHLPQQAPVSTARRARLFVAWWQQQIHVYHVAKRNQAGQAVDHQGKDYSLVGTLQLKGEEHIESAAISEDGSLIIGSTSAGVRLFQVRIDTGGTPRLRSRQIELPASLHRFGARLVGISPNSKWVYAVRMDNTVVVSKLVVAPTVATTKEKPRIHRAITKLVIPSTPTLPTLGGGAYTAGICSAAFSPDSRVLAIGTLGGAIAAWTLTGEEAAAADHSNNINGKPDAADDSSAASSDSSDNDSDSDSDSDSESDTPTIANQRWIATPDRKSGTRFPQLDSPITVLTFRPPLSSSPSPPHHLVAISASGTLTEVDVSTGRLTEWWRRNRDALVLSPSSSSSSPSPSSSGGLLLNRTKDVLRGCFWDSKRTKKNNNSSSNNNNTSQQQRLWLYGSMVVHMLEMSADLPLPVSHHSKDNAAAVAVAVVVDNGVNENENENADQDQDQENEGQPRKWWSTFEYRAILGAGVIGEEEEEEEEEEEGAVDAMDIDTDNNNAAATNRVGNGDNQKETETDTNINVNININNIEVVIIERPLWDIQGTAV